MNQQVQTLLEQMAHMLGTTIQYLWGVEMRQAYVIGIENFVWAIVLAIVLYPMIKVIKKCFHDIKVASDYYSNEYTWFDDELPYIWIIILTGIAVIIIVLFLVFDLNAGINDLINPAHFALQDISSFVQSGGK